MVSKISITTILVKLLQMILSMILVWQSVNLSGFFPVSSKDMYISLAFSLYLQRICISLWLFPCIFKGYVFHIIMVLCHIRLVLEEGPGVPVITAS